MGIKTYKPTSPGRRGMTGSDFAEITTDKAPEKTLTRAGALDGRPQQPRPHHLALHAAAATSSATASSTSSATRRACRPRSRRSSTIRTAPAASRCCTTPTARSATSWRPTGSRSATTVISAPARPTSGRATRCRCASIPLGTVDPQRRAARSARGGQLARSAGTSAQLMAKEGDYAQIRLPSGEVRMVHLELPRHHRPGRQHRPRATSQWGKAGRMRWMGLRPHNRGVAMNPVDHPMGGGEGAVLGRPPPVLALGQADQGLQDPHQQARPTSSSSVAAAKKG